MKTLKIFLFVLFFLEQKNKLAGKQLKLIYEKDVSVHCRRRVMPSIFLGRQVIEANARILQFSRLELPYSCYISISSKGPWTYVFDINFNLIPPGIPEKEGLDRQTTKWSYKGSFFLLRTESGSSMVMMIQVTSTAVRESCKNSGQLLVYEMGETFGGYWGPLPDKVLRREPLPPKAYTLKTTQVTLTTTESLTEEEEVSETTQTSTVSSRPFSTKPTGDYVEVEVPLLNVSVHYVPAKEIQSETHNTEGTFDLHNDVTPIPGVAYDTSILPLVQFRLVDQQSGRRSDDGDGGPPEYDLDIAQDFTPDMRLTLPRQLNPTSKRRHKPLYEYQATRRLNFKKHRTLFHSQRHSDRRVILEKITRKNKKVTKYSFPTTRNVTIDKSKHTQDSWKVIKELLKKLNKTKAKTVTTTMSIEEAMLLERISNMDQKKSAYLSSNLSQYAIKNEAYTLIFTKSALLSTWNPVSLISNSTQDYINKEPISNEPNEISSVTVKGTRMTTGQSKIYQISKSTKSINENVNTKAFRTDQAPSVTVPTLLSGTSHISDRTTRNDELFGKTSISEMQLAPLETTASKSLSTERVVDSKNKLHVSTFVTGSMVGHESWENVVQAAPEMAVHLNQSVADFISRGNTSDDNTKETHEAPNTNKMLKRKKRDIHSIAIENAKPHHITTRKALATTTQLSFNVADMQEFAQLVELQDDELHGRVALRHLNQFVGPPLFNLCDIPDPTKPHVHLFNSSRIVLSPTNFTLDRMVIILTAARALLSGELRCPRAKIECQVSGARVCLDNMVACDGVPNCGSYDIYDEDRLMCGHTAALQHNVYLAAFTFLAVLLTIIYAVHYWLKRCVPKVADAFFIYSDGVENILYLDTIMRSPHDMGEDPKLVYHSHMYGDDIYDDVAERHKNACLRYLRKLCCCRKTLNKNDEKIAVSNVNLSMSRRMYSFTELEIRKMIASSKDTAVQTGDSLEMRPLENFHDKINLSLSGKQQVSSETAESYDFSPKIKDSLLTLEEPLPEEHTDELSLLQFLNAAARARRNYSKDHSMGLVESEASTEMPPEKKINKNHTRVDSPSERELEIHTYDRQGLSIFEPGPSNRRDSDKGQIHSTSSVSKHLRFDDVTTTIPTERYNDNNENITNADGRRMVVLGESRRRISHPLDTIEEADEQGGSSKEHRHFWGTSKSKKSKKKAQVSLR